ncbi:hypothetical protein HC891_07355 [Candidatus Gracilibacteria bacterium]|nr:hypothetical protein [Candidatus Gracilibacteria bacterium]
MAPLIRPAMTVNVASCCTRTFPNTWTLVSGGHTLSHVPMLVARLGVMVGGSASLRHGGSFISQGLRAWATVKVAPELMVTALREAISTGTIGWYRRPGRSRWRKGW